MIQGIRQHRRPAGRVSRARRAEITREDTWNRGDARDEREETLCWEPMESLPIGSCYYCGGLQLLSFQTASLYDQEA